MARSFIGVWGMGVWGPGGVGKTTLVRKVAERLEAEKVFERTILASASVTHDSDPDLTKIQQEIVDCLNFNIGLGSGEARKSRLHERLRLEKSILIILDDTWRKIELEELGIPLGSDKRRVCKVLVTSTRKRVILAMGAIDKSCLHLDVLEEREGLQFFTKTLGDMEDPNVKSVALKIISQCSGPPILLLPVATTLKTENKMALWEDTLEQLRKFDGKSEWEKEAYTTLERSYNFLEDEMKNVFMLVAQVGPSQVPVQILFMYAYAICRGLFENFTTLAQARNRFYKVVEDLTSSSLLKSYYREQHYKLLDAVHSFALSHASREHKSWLVMHGNAGALEKWPKTEIFSKCTSISLRNCRIPKLPEVLPCLNLEFLVIEFGNSPELCLPDNFFKETKILKALHLRVLHLMPFPSSIKFLENLESLVLISCTVGDIIIIGELKKLQILCLEDLSIAYLPETLQQLGCLRLFNLLLCQSLKTIPPNILSSLTELDELNVEGCSSIELNRAFLVELEKLPNFTTLHDKRGAKRLFSKAT